MHPVIFAVLSILVFCYAPLAVILGFFGFWMFGTTGAFIGAVIGLLMQHG